MAASPKNKKKPSRKAIPCTANQHRKIIDRLMRKQKRSMYWVAENAQVSRRGLGYFLREGSNPSCDWLDKVYKSLGRRIEIRMKMK